MKEISSEIKDLIEKGKAIYGMRKCLKYLKMNEPKKVIIASNIPENLKNDIYSLVNPKKIEIFEGTSLEMGKAIGKPYSVCIIVIK